MAASEIPHLKWYNVQFLGWHEVPSHVAALFGENWGRLVELKKKYDPMGLFRNTFWPLDKDGCEMDPSMHEILSIPWPHCLKSATL